MAGRKTLIRMDEHFICKQRVFGSGGTRIRTGDTMIFSHVLYQLSYPAGEALEILRYGQGAIKSAGAGPHALPANVQPSSWPA